MLGRLEEGGGEGSGSPPKKLNCLRKKSRREE